jgi:transposase
VGACPGHDKSAAISRSHRSPNGNRQMRRLLNQAAHAAVNTKGSLCELLYRRFVVRLSYAQAVGAIAHRLCRLVWKILHDAPRTRNAAQPSAKGACIVEPPR